MQRPVRTNVTPLPQGWEECVTEDGRMYFVDHNSQTTAWERPTVATQVPQFSIPATETYPSTPQVDISNLSPDEQFQRALEESRMEVQIIHCDLHMNPMCTVY